MSGKIDNVKSSVWDGLRPHDCNVEELRICRQSVIDCSNEEISCRENFLLNLGAYGLKSELQAKSFSEIDEINRLCIYEDFFDILQEKYSDEYAGNENLFEPVLKNVTEANNFYIQTLMVTLIMTSKRIIGNIGKFRKDFKISKLYRINDHGINKCYVIVSSLKPYWTLSSLHNFIDGTKKLRLFHGQKRGYFIWVGLKNIVSSWRTAR